MITGTSISAKSPQPSPLSELSCAGPTCRKIAALLRRPSPRSARMARTCSFLQKPNNTWLRSRQQNLPRGEQPTAVLDTEQGYSKVPGTDPSSHWRSHQDGSLQPLEVPKQWAAAPATPHWWDSLLLLVLREISCCLSTPMMPFACFPEKLWTFCLMIILRWVMEVLIFRKLIRH